MKKLQESIFGTDKIVKGYKKFNKSEKTILWIFTGSIILSLCLMGLMSTIRTYDSDLSIQQCNQLRADDMRFALELQEENNILAFIYAFQFPFKFLIIAIAIAWILHGVGFTVVGR